MQQQVEGFEAGQGLDQIGAAVAIGDRDADLVGDAVVQPGDVVGVRIGAVR